MTTIRVHPYFDPCYYAFYWEGLVRRGHRVVISSEGFPATDEPGFYDFKDGFVALVETRSGVRRLAISADDRAVIRPAVEAWADRLGKVNLDPADTMSHPTTMALGPSFGVRGWSPASTARLALACRRATSPTLRAQRQDKAFITQLRKRVPEERYRPVESDSDYVFFTAWPWTKHPEVNPPRAEFIRACQRHVGLNFDGGFAPRRRGNPSEFADLLAPGRYPLPDYLARIGRSAAVFNNPAVHGCLGWKLGEFLALGKAIISLPLGRCLPADLEDGVHAHFVDGSPASLDEALTRLCGDDAYRQGLEAAARRYYDQWLSPVAVTGRLLDGWDLD